MTTLTLIHGYRRSQTNAEQAAESMAVTFKIFALHVASCEKCCAMALSPVHGPGAFGVTLCSIGVRCVETWRMAHSLFWNEKLRALTRQGAPHAH